MPGLFSPCHCIENKGKFHIMEALKYGYTYLRQPTLKQSCKLTCSNFKWPFLVEALEAMEKTIGEFRVISFNEEVLGAAPWPNNLRQTLKLLAQMRKDYQYDILAEGLAIPVPPIWGKDNDPQQWWRINNYEILSAAFHHEVELFLKSFVPYLPKGEKEFRPTTPWKTLILPAVSEPLPPKNLNQQRMWPFWRSRQFPVSLVVLD